MPALHPVPSPARVTTLRLEIECGRVPRVWDASSHSDLVWTWADIEDAGYGRTLRAICGLTGKCLVTRIYTGPGPILLAPWEKVLRAGDRVSDDD